MFYLRNPLIRVIFNLGYVALQKIAGHYTLRCAGLFNLPIPLSYAFGFGISQ